MLKIFHIIIFLVVILFSIGRAFAAMPFTDVHTYDPYYDAVTSLYNGQIITDNGEHLFRPNDLIARDFFLSLAVGIGCHKCETPNIEDIIQYRISPFVDLLKTNPYYYCISYANDSNIALGYTPNTSGYASCENNKQYTSSPFCPDNTITRIEATAILLRRANLWNDTLNSGNYVKNISIPDVSLYWYGYAKKGIEVGIIKQKSDGRIGQDEKITRSEFAIMTARTLQYTQCQSENTTNTIESSIEIRNGNGESIQKSQFLKGELFSLVPITKAGNWNYSYTARNPNTGEIIAMSGSSLTGSTLPEGNWIVMIHIIDPKNSNIISEPYTAITIGDTATGYHGYIGIKEMNGNLSNTNIFSTNNPITIVSTYTGGPGDQTWRAVDAMGRVVTGEGQEFPGSKLGEGVWTITLTTRKPGTGEIIDTSTRSIRITSGTIPSNIPNQNLSVFISANSLVSDLGKEITFSSSVTNGASGLNYRWNLGDGNSVNGTGSIHHAYSNPGLYTVTLTITNPTTGDTSQSQLIIRVTGNRDTDSDGIIDTQDQCPLVYSKNPTGCPLISIYNSNNTLGTSNHGSSTNSYNGSLGNGFNNNTCLSEKQKTQGLLIGTPNCTQCPCKNSISIDSPLRACDIVFPTILSPTFDTVYARGGFYLIQ